MTKQYLNLIEEVLDKGKPKEDRTGVGTISLFSPSPLEFDLREGFPLLTTKQTFFRIVKEELLWFLSGSDNIKPLLDKNVHIWDGNGIDYWLKSLNTFILEDVSSMPSFSKESLHTAMEETFGLAFDPSEFTGDINNKLKDKDFSDRYQQVKELYFNLVDEDDSVGKLGHIYPVAWRNFGFKGVDQIKNVIDSLKNDPDSRRHIVNAWNPVANETGNIALPPCHLLFQFYVEDGKYLHCKMYQRSMDIFLGEPLNIASYALLTHLIARETGYEAGRLIITAGDAHIYNNHLDAIKEQSTREPLPLPKLVIKDTDKTIFELTGEDISIEGYTHQGKIKAPMAI